MVVYFSNRDWYTFQVVLTTNMFNMFSDAESFTSDLSKWDVSNVTDMSGMFLRARKFNGDISRWDVSNVTDMAGMFSGATSFDQNIGSWNISNVKNMHLYDYYDELLLRIGMFKDVTLSTGNYSAILKGWASQPVQNNIKFDGGNSKYSQDAAAARESLINDHHWKITDGGPE